MALTQNVALRNILAPAFGNVFNSGTLEIRTAGGTTLLATITLPASAFGAPASGVIAKAGTWNATAAASGVARVGRFIGGSAEAEVTIGETGSGADMIVDDENIVAGGTVTVVSFDYTVPA